jgi:RimJ/RimL family protein N-acetyltransferase
MIKTRRLVMEPVTPDHAEAMFEGLRDPRGYMFMPDDPPETIAALRSRFQVLARGAPPDGSEIWLNWMLRRRRRRHYVGFVQATVTPAARTSLVAYHIFPAFWRQGFGREALAAMLEEIALRHDVREAEAYIDTRNIASIRLVEAEQFVLRERIDDADVIRGERSDEFVYTKRLEV